ncbi:hypothetical protein [Pseudomonas sp. HMSC066A08]|uniref:hypothetical protein n=1 Tax=Pseudomonas TaxID=286 RepID=UPI0009A43922|nr:hypothetical protein [Pseudomonas aeruginosa]RPY31906.1 hypothetical protein IPC692_28010 [Pseudomonas aeruginosa]RPY42442.1 hypothetical protein IPC688_27060 [Pseudomonas aeruginosa]RUE55934.1 hypothetical protein IPC1224_14530 [Pseudomonas aeruginosa]WCV89446.1 hypothetical protein KK172_21555 [Pseudomonas aeruginosa]
MQSNTARFLVAIEGSDGSGKSTLIQALEARSMQRNVSFLKRSFHDQPMVKDIIRNFEAHHCITNEMLSACLWASAAYTMEQVAGSPAQLVVCDRYDLTGRLYDRFCGIPSRRSLPQTQHCFPGRISTSNSICHPISHWIGSCRAVGRFPSLKPWTSTRVDTRSRK